MNSQLSENDLAQRALSGLLWTMSCSGTQMLLQILSLAVLARLLTPADFGLVGAAFVVVGFSTIFSQFGIGPAVVQRADLETCHIRVAFTISVALGLVIYALIWLTAPLAAAALRIDGLTPVLRTLALLFPIYSVSAVGQALLQRRLQFRLLSCLDVGSYVFGYMAVSIPLAAMGLGVWALVGAYLGQAALKSLVLLLLQGRGLVPSIERRALWELLRFGGGLTLARIANYLASQGDKAIIARSIGAEALGIYGRAYQLMAAPVFIFSNATDMVIFPAMSKLQDQRPALVTGYRRSISLAMIVTLPASIILYIVAPEVVQVLLGSEWSEVILPLQVLAFGMAFQVSDSTGTSLAKAMGAVYQRASRQAIYCVMVVGGAWIGHYWGLAGVAFGVLSALALNGLVTAHLCVSLLKMRWMVYFRAFIPGILLAIVLGAVVWATAVTLRMIDVPPAVILLAAAAVTSGCVVLLVRIRPAILWGPDGLWLIESLTGWLSQYITRVRQQNKGTFASPIKGG
jgi:O-antigen/teichoic acid export membrane protein